MFTRLQHSLTAFKGICLQLTSDMHGKLHTWVHLLEILQNHPTDLHEISPFPPSWFGATYASGTGMDNVCRENNDNGLYGPPPFPPPYKTDLSPLTTQEAASPSTA